MRVTATKPVGWFTRGRQIGSFGSSGPRRTPGPGAAGALPQLLVECRLGPFMGADLLPNEEEREEKELEECELDERKELEDEREEDRWDEPDDLEEWELEECLPGGMIAPPDDMFVWSMITYAGLFRPRSG